MQLQGLETKRTLFTRHDGRLLILNLSTQLTEKRIRTTLKEQKKISARLDTPISLQPLSNPSFCIAGISAPFLWTQDSGAMT